MSTKDFYFDASTWLKVYERVLSVPLVVALGDLMVNKPLLLWINDGLMVLFFFVVGLEIKRLGKAHLLGLQEQHEPRRSGPPMVPVTHPLLRQEYRVANWHRGRRDRCRPGLSERANRRLRNVGKHSR